MTKLLHTVPAIATLLILSACGKSSDTATPAPTPQVAPQASTQQTSSAAPPPAGTSPVTAHAAAATAVASPEPASPPPLVYPAPTAKKAAPTTRVAKFAGLETDIPLSWNPVPPANSMRLAEFQAPTEGQAPAEAVVFFFPPGQGGPKDMNIARWASQFTDSKGAPVKPVISESVINSMPVTRIELNGNYSRGVGMGTTEGAVKANQTLLAAIITTPAGNVTIHFFGPQASVKKQRESFESVLKSIRYKG